MDNKEFEKQLEKIKELKEVPLSVDEKIQKAFEKIEENEKQEKEIRKQNRKFNFSRVLSLAASFIVVIFLAGNGVAYAKGEPNIYSWILEKIGIAKDYEEIKTDINKTVENNGVKITLLDAGYDKNYLLVGYKIQIEEDIFGDIKQDLEGIYIYERYLLQRKDGTIIGEFDVCLGEHYIVNKISDNEYIFYSIKDISIYDLDNEEIYISVKIYNIAGTDINGKEIENAELKGNWEFNQQSINFGNTDYKEYVIDLDKTINDEFKINSIRVINTKLFSNIYVDKEVEIDYDKYEGTPTYSIVLLDGETILADSIRHIGYGSDKGIFLEKVEENKTYTIQVRKRLDDPKDAGVIVEDNLLDEFGIELNKDNIIEDTYYIAENIVTYDGWIIKQIKVENSNINSKLTIETGSYDWLEEEQISETKVNYYRNMLRIYDKNNNLIKEIDPWYGKEIFVNEFELGEEYIMRVYRYLSHSYKGIYITYSVDRYQSEEDLTLVSQYKFILK